MLSVHIADDAAPMRLTIAGAGQPSAVIARMEPAAPDLIATPFPPGRVLAAMRKARA